MDQISKMDQFPNEILLLISEFLSGKEISKLMSTNSRLFFLFKHFYKNKEDYILYRHDYSLGFYITGGGDFLTEEDKSYLNFKNYNNPSNRLIDNFNLDFNRPFPRVLFCNKSKEFNGGYLNTTCGCGKEICNNQTYNVNPYLTSSDLVIRVGDNEFNQLEPFFKGKYFGLIKGIYDSCKKIYNNDNPSEL